ncbi:hypothetical protein SADUNF_Sadunf06G0181200 [Salix dunnii]|uniref:Serine aminopeptidase S33 domain-containing protein n=1 Tax=Salix dunnii TaxID=1413687 RepID=A0A835K5A6_9ROSI|nr:hypothetical protein SADUNF_Sadunf06G0181200 [Salix dunnii]
MTRSLANLVSLTFYVYGLPIFSYDHLFVYEFMFDLLAAVQQRRVVIENNHGEKLSGILHETGSKQLVIVCHGFQSSKERIPMVNLASALEKEGISAFRFDFAGNGESEGLFQYGNYRREAEDLRAVVQYFRGENRVISAVIGHSKGSSKGVNIHNDNFLFEIEILLIDEEMFSHLKWNHLDYGSLEKRANLIQDYFAGGNVVLLYASKYNDVHTVVNISGRFNLEKGMEGRLGKDFLLRLQQHGYIDVFNRKGKFEYRVTEESLKDRLTTDTCEACLSIQQDCRVLTVHGSMDKIVPVEDALEFVKFIPNHKLHIIKGANHEYTSHQGELTSVVLDFLRESFNVEKDMPKLLLKDHSFRSRL